MKPRSALRMLCAGIFLASLATSPVSAIQVRYQVDLSVQIALGNFNPASDNVFVSGNHSSPAWQSAANSVATNYILAPSATNANVYVGTFEIATAPGNWEDHKFVLNGGNTFTCLTWEDVSGGGNRFFQAQATNMVLPTVYFSDQSTMPSSVPVTFNVDVGVQQTLGNFNPATDFVIAAGAFSVNCGNWATDFVLTNIPDTTIYSGTWEVTRISPGGTVNHKYIINSFNLGMSWEANGVGPNGAANRQFTLPATATNLPVVFFNNITNTSALVTTQVTFKVNLGVQIARGLFDPNGGTVSVAGDPINAWSPILTPLSQTVTNPLVWSTTVNITNTVGGPVNYKFVLNGGGTWEPNGVGPNGANDRQFIFTNVATVLPDVYFANIGNLGTLTAGPITGGQIPLSWTAGPLVRLQTNNPITGTWGDVPGSEGVGSLSFDVGAARTFFRLTGP